LTVAALAPGVARANVVVSSGVTENMSCSAGVCSPTAVDAVLNVNDLENLLASGDVDVTTNGADVQADSIEIDAPISWAQDSSLTLDAYVSVLVNKRLAVAGPGSLSITTNDGGAQGVLLFGAKGSATFAQTSSNLSINGVTYALMDSLKNIIRAIKADPSGSFALAKSYNVPKHLSYRTAAIKTPFAGNFNGLGNSISRLHISGHVRSANYGMFANVEASANISSLRIADETIEAGEKSLVGGIAAVNYGTVFNSAADGTITATSSLVGNYGGAVGSNRGIMVDVVANTGIVIGPREAGQMVVGGLVGGSDGSIEESYSTGSISVTGRVTEPYIGGLVGYNGGDVQNCYANVSVSANGKGGYALAGGLIGWNFLNISSSYSTGALVASGAGNEIGGLIGLDESQTNGGSIEAAYWDTTTSGITDPGQGAGNIPNDPGIEGETSKQLRGNLPNGFDPSIWAEDKKINNGFPYLINNPPS
jgi:hypothetical protein